MASQREMGRAIQSDINDANKRLKTALTVSPALASKLASIVLHTEEMLSVKGHFFDKVALEAACRDPEVKAWMKALGPLVPVKR